MGLGIPPLRIKIMLESNLLKSTMLVGRLGVPVSVTNTHFMLSLALQSSSKNCHPASDLMFLRLNLPWVFLSGGVFFFTDTGVNEGGYERGAGIPTQNISVTTYTITLFKLAIFNMHIYINIYIYIYNLSYNNSN